MKIYIEIDVNNFILSYSITPDNTRTLEVETDLDLDLDLDLDIVGRYKLKDNKLVELTEDEKKANESDGDLVSEHEKLTKEIRDIAEVSSGDNLLNMDMIMSLDDKLNMIMEHLGLC